MKTKLRSILPLLTFAFSAGFSFGQIDHTNVREGEAVEYCTTHKKMEARKKDPEFLKAFLKSREELDAAILKMEQDGAKRGPIYTIPVVFHVLHNNGAENISDEQIYDAFYIFNRDYRKRNADTATVVTSFQSRIADTEIEFALATKAPDGTIFNGITRTVSAATSSGDGDVQIQAIAAGNDVYQGEWEGDKYLNIFICADIGGAAGYTQTPFNWGGWGASMGNGIYILHEYVGSIGSGNEGRSRALTHEVGHWLDLDHTWGSNNNPGNASSCGTDDAVSDTPNTIGVTSCNLTEASCGPLANVENYMDYSYCSKMFTKGQSTRMRAALNSSTGGRDNISTPTNLAETGSDYIVSVNFDATKTSLCSTGQVQFFDKSYNHIVSRTWNFYGATVAVSNEMDPIVEYNTPGIYAVALTVSDGVTSLTKTKFIRVYSEPRTMPVLDGFELYEEIGNTIEWEVFNEQNNATFEVVQGVAATGNKSLKIDNFNTTVKSTDELLSATYDFSGVTSSTQVTISFKYSYRKKVAANTEKLQVMFSPDCGDSWSIRKTIQGTSLSSSESTTPWTPTLPEDWVQVHLTNVTSGFWNENFRFKFHFEGSGGNNLYLDDINVYNSGPSSVLVGEEVLPSVGLEEKTMEAGMLIYPNPADHELNVSYTAAHAGETKITVIDVLGKQLIEQTIQSAAGNNLVVMPTENLSEGMYLVKTVVDGKTYTKNLMIK